jgi:hypothetical protein
MTYSELQAWVLKEAVHAELTTEVVTFIAQCEALITRKIRAIEVDTTILEASRTLAGVYALPGRVLKVRVLQAPATDGVALENVGLAGIHMLPATADVQHYAIVGQNVEFRGVPGPNADFRIVYIGWPAALASANDTNEILTDHSDVYIAGALHYLYRYTQDFEAAQLQLSAFTDAAADLNAATARRFGGSSQLPAYNFGHVRVGRGY